uniref:Uncharacterized protein n=1 Tax=Meloidogyne enterolobii TaxID=390850 RepID=A0A6V7V157_MELEN|nr:unnamed protein product [Meloidogyne enterolobii]
MSEDDLIKKLEYFYLDLITIEDEEEEIKISYIINVFIQIIAVDKIIDEKADKFVKEAWFNNYRERFLLFCDYLMDQEKEYVELYGVHYLNILYSLRQIEMLETNDSKNSRELFDKINIKLQIIQEPLINFEDQIKQLAKEHYKIIEIIKDKYEGFRGIIEKAEQNSMVNKRLENLFKYGFIKNKYLNNKQKIQKLKQLNEKEYDKISENISENKTNNTKVFIDTKLESRKIECQNPLNGKSVDNDYVKLFFDYKIKASEWDNLYWRITVDLVEKKLCDVADNLVNDFDLIDSEEMDKLNEEESIYSQIHHYVIMNKENTIAKLFSYNGGFDLPPLNELQETDQKVLDNSKLSMNDCMRITILHLNAIKQLIEDDFDFDLVYLKGDHLYNIGISSIY